MEKTPFTTTEGHLEITVQKWTLSHQQFRHDYDGPSFENSKQRIINEDSYFTHSDHRSAVINLVVFIQDEDEPKETIQAIVTLIISSNNALTQPDDVEIALMVLIEMITKHTTYYRTSTGKLFRLSKYDYPKDLLLNIIK